jgi:iron complex transport system substrate-binding protein
MGSGEGRENRLRSRHCNRLKVAVSQVTLRCRRGCVLREKERRPIAPGVSWGFFCGQNHFEARKLLKRSSHFASAERRGVALRLVCAAINVIFVVAAFASGATAQISPPATSPVPLYREVTDETGRLVRVPQPVARIVSLAPSVTETIYALGLQDKLVGDTDFCDYPPDAQKKPKVGGAVNPSLEEIAHLRPDLVLVTRHLNTLDTVHSLDSLGIASYATDPQSIEGIISSLRRLAEVLGASQAGAEVEADLRRRLAALSQKLGAQPPRRVLFVVWSDPLISIGKDTFIADALRRAGAVSIVDSQQDWPQVNLEEMARLQPDFLVFAASHSESTPQNFEALVERPGWRILNAVRDHKFAVISDAVNRPAPRIVSAIEDLAAKLHPEVFGEKPAVAGPSAAARENKNLQAACACGR